MCRYYKLIFGGYTASILLLSVFLDIATYNEIRTVTTHHFNPAGQLVGFNSLQRLGAVQSQARARVRITCLGRTWQSCQSARGSEARGGCRGDQAPGFLREDTCSGVVHTLIDVCKCWSQARCGVLGFFQVSVFSLVQ